MFDIICVTSRTLCCEEFLNRLEKIAAARPAGIILREKDLTETAYRQLAQQVLALCQSARVPCILHGFVHTAIALKAGAIHVPLPVLRSMTAAQKRCFRILGASCHSTEEALEAQALGCTYITAGHIFQTGCKHGLPGRGPGFLQDICSSVSVPVYAIGGINSENLCAVRQSGARGACIMSSLMQCPDPGKYLQTLVKAGEQCEIQP